MKYARLDESKNEINIARRNINNLGYVNDTTPMAESKEELSHLLMKVKEESENAGLKLNIWKMMTITSRSMTSWQVEGEKLQILFSWAPQSLWMVIAAMKLKDASSLEGKLWKT